MIIFPVVDYSNRIRGEGPAISVLAAHAATYMPNKHLRLAPSLVAEVLVAEQLVRLKRPEEGLVNLLGLAASHADDPYYFGALMRCAIALGNDSVTTRLLEIWKDRDLSYMGQLARGRAWLSFADMGSRAIEPDQEQVRARATAAMRELEQCLERNPNALLARSELLSLHRFLDLPYEFAQRQFDAIVRKRPRFRDAYLNKMQYLIIRRDEHADELTNFVGECIETKLWDDGIPQCLFEAITLVAMDPVSRQFDYGVVKSQEVWAAIRLCHGALVSSAIDLAEKEAANKKAAVWGTYGEHYWDALELFCSNEFEFEDGHRADPVIGVGASFGISPMFLTRRWVSAISSRWHLPRSTCLVGTWTTSKHICGESSRGHSIAHSFCRCKSTI